MKIPRIRGLIDRRILVNYQVDPEVIERVLPPHFRPVTVAGRAIAGICLIRLRRVRPRLAPPFLGLSSENAAHRIAVEWDDGDGRRREGVYIPRRDTSSRLNALAGGRVFPGVHHHARFAVRESDDSFRVELESDDGVTRVLVSGHVAAALPDDSVFESVEHASDFFERGALGYSPRIRSQRAGGACECFDGLELHSFNWSVQPLEVDEIESSFFEDRDVFPEGSVEFDSALLMRGIEHEWLARGEIETGGDATRGGRSASFHRVPVSRRRPAARSRP